MLTGKTLKRVRRERHHYWPRGVSKYWIDNDGKACRLECDGTILRDNPSKFGFIGDGHRVNFKGSPWDGTIEDLFAKADNDFPYVIDALSKLETKPTVPQAAFSERFLAQPVPHELQLQLGECLASLLVRCPAFRSLVALQSEHFRRRFGFTEEMSRVERTTLTAMNINQRYNTVKDTLMSGGRFIALISNSSEFIFGDGFLNSIQGPSYNSDGKCLIPLTPTMSVAFCRALGHPNLVTIDLSPDEVRMCNDLVQVYTKDYVYFRSEKPSINAEFARREFLELQNHGHAWLDRLLDAAAKFPTTSPGS